MNYKNRLMDFNKVKTWGVFGWGAPHELSLRLFLVPSMSGAQIINNPWVCYSNNLPPMIKMLDLDITQCGTQATSLVIMIGSCSPDSQNGISVVILRMLAVLFSGSWMTILGTTHIRDLNGKHGLGKTTNLHYTAILGATLHKEDIGK